MLTHGFKRLSLLPGVRVALGRSRQHFRSGSVDGTTLFLCLLGSGSEGKRGGQSLYLCQDTSRSHHVKSLPTPNSASLETKLLRCELCEALQVRFVPQVSWGSTGMFKGQGVAFR